MVRDGGNVAHGVVVTNASAWVAVYNNNASVHASGWVRPAETQRTDSLAADSDRALSQRGAAHTESVRLPPLVAQKTANAGCIVHLDDDILLGDDDILCYTI